MTLSRGALIGRRQKGSGPGGGAAGPSKFLVPVSMTFLHGTVFPSGTPQAALADASDSTGINSAPEDDDYPAGVFWGGGVTDIAVSVKSFYVIVRASVAAGSATIFCSLNTSGPSAIPTPGTATLSSTSPVDVIVGPFTKSGGGTWSPAQFNPGGGFGSIFLVQINSADCTLYKVSVVAYQ